MDYMSSIATFTSSYIDSDDSANVILVDRNSNSINENDLSENFGNINSSVLFIFSPEPLINSTHLPDVLNATVKNEVGYRDPLSIILPISVCYFVIFVTGILGNVVTCVVIAKNKTMHTATNYYLFNLAVSDFLVLIFGKSNKRYCWAFDNNVRCSKRLSLIAWRKDLASANHASWFWLIEFWQPVLSQICFIINIP